MATEPLGIVLFLRCRKASEGERGRACRVTEPGLHTFNVLHVASGPGVGGAQVYVETVAGRIRQLGHWVAVDCSSDPPLVARYAVFPMSS